MAKYIVYCLNEAGKIWRSNWVDAASDQEALDAARALDATDRSNGCEVWDHDRLVGTVEGGPD